MNDPDGDLPGFQRARSTRAHQWSLCAAALLCASCSAPPQAHDGTFESPRARAAQARADSERMRTRATLDELELRVRDLSPNNLADGEGIDLGVRLPFDDPPWANLSREASWAAEADAEIARAELHEHEHQIDTCLQGAERATWQTASQAHERTLDAIEPIFEWNDAWAQSGTIDALEAATLRLELELWAARSMPRRPSADVEAAALPTLDEVARAGEAAEQVDQRAIAALITAHHPALREEAARSEAYALRVEEADGTRWPWISFVELGYELAASPSAGDVAARLGIAIPMGREASSDAARYDALATSMALERDATLQELAEEARAAAASLDALAEHARRTQRVLEVAEDAERVARDWRTQRLGSPRDVARVLRDVHMARTLALEIRSRAAVAQCRWQAATGHRWPPP